MSSMRIEGETACDVLIITVGVAWFIGLIYSSIIIIVIAAILTVVTMIKIKKTFRLVRDIK